MATFIKAKLKKSDDQTHIDKYIITANIAEYHICEKRWKTDYEDYNNNAFLKGIFRWWIRMPLVFGPNCNQWLSVVLVGKKF